MSNKIKVKVENLNLYYGENHALKDVNMDIQENAVTALSDHLAVVNQHF